MVTFKNPDVEQFFRTYSIQTFAVSPDERQIILSTNLSGKYNLWGMDVPNQFPYPLTFVDQSCQELSYDKNGRFILAGFDKDGDENTQLYALPLQGGELKGLRESEGNRHMNPILSSDGKTMYYTSTKGNPTYLSTYRYDIETEEESVIYEGSKAATFLAEVSPNEQSFLYVMHFANTHTLAFVNHNGVDTLVTPETEQQHTVSDVVFTSDHEIYLITNYDGDLGYLAKFNLKTNEFFKVLTLDKEDLSSLKYNKNQNVLYLTSSKGVEDILYEYDLSTGKHSKVDVPVGVIEKLVVSKQGNLYLLGRSATRPMNIYKKETENGEWTPLTNYSVPGVAEDDLVEPEVITYPSFDGLEIEALFFRAKEEVSNGHVILWPHGGPQSAERKWFRALFQFLVNRGYSLFAPNFRGSSNYGLSFMKLVEGDWGYGPRLDNIEGLEWLIKNGYADREKVLLLGGSYGGYMALLLHGRHPEYFKAVVDIFGPSDLFSFINSVPEHWKPIMNQWVGDPVKDKEKLIEYSPITYLKNMVKPMLVIQGANDPRVVKTESDQIVKALQENGVNVEYLVLEDEGHGFSKKENEINVYRTILEFFDRCI